MDLIKGYNPRFGTSKPNLSRRGAESIILTAAVALRGQCFLSRGVSCIYAHQLNTLAPGHGCGRYYTNTYWLFDAVELLGAEQPRSRCSHRTNDTAMRALVGNLTATYSVCTELCT